MNRRTLIGSVGAACLLDGLADASPSGAAPGGVRPPGAIAPRSQPLTLAELARRGNVSPAPKPDDFDELSLSWGAWVTLSPLDPDDVVALRYDEIGLRSRAWYRLVYGDRNGATEISRLEALDGPQIVQQSDPIPKTAPVIPGCQLSLVSPVALADIPFIGVWTRGHERRESLIVAFSGGKHRVLAHMRMRLHGIYAWPLAEQQAVGITLLTEGRVPREAGYLWRLWNQPQTMRWD